MTDKKKVIKGLEDTAGYFRYLQSVGFFGDQPVFREHEHHCNDALSLLKEQEEREKRICKEICDFIRGSCSTDTDADKEYVCHVIQQMFNNEGR